MFNEAVLITISLCIATCTIVGIMSTCEQHRYDVQRETGKVIIPLTEGK